MSLLPKLSFSIQATYTWFPAETTFGISDASAVLLRRPFDLLVNVSPPSVLALNIISQLPGVLSLHTTYTLLPEADIAGSTEAPELGFSYYQMKLLRTRHD